MNDVQERKYASNLRVESICDAHKSVWEGLPAFARNYKEFQLVQRAIEEKRNEQETEKIGFTKARDNKKEELAQSGLLLSGALSAYADEKGDAELGEQIHFTHSDLFPVRDSVAKARAKLLYDNSAKLLNELADYGITGDDLKLQQQLMTEFDQMIARKDHIGEDTQEATGELAQLFGKADILLKNRMDKLMERFKKDNPHFYGVYFNARDIENVAVKEEGVPAAPPLPPPQEQK